MKSIIEIKKDFQEHEMWINTLGKEGVKLVLDEIDLRSIVLDEEKYEQAYLANCIFDARNLKGNSFYLTKLFSTSFKNCILENIDFTKADLSYVDFSNATLFDVKLNKCDCIETNFRNAHIENANMQDSLFDSSDFRNATLSNVILSFSNFEEILVNGMTLNNVKGFDKIIDISINITDFDNPIILKGEEAIYWLRNNALK